MLHSTPGIYEPYLSNPTPPVDEWTLSQAMAADTANGGLQAIMENHYKTFIVRQHYLLSRRTNLNSSRTD
jgi:glucan 1,3-beta-glucosidase